MSDVYRLVITPGVPLTVPMTYKRNGAPSQVDSPKAQIWTRRTGGQLVSNLSGYFTQPAPGALTLTLSADFTGSLADKVDAELWWDAYAVVDGAPVRLIAPSPVLVKARTSAL